MRVPPDSADPASADALEDAERRDWTMRGTPVEPLCNCTIDSRRAHGAPSAGFPPGTAPGRQSRFARPAFMPLPPLPLARWLPDVVALARRAGEVVLEVYAAGCAVRTKADASPVTEADERAEAL